VSATSGNTGNVEFNWSSWQLLANGMISSHKILIESSYCQFHLEMPESFDDDDDSDDYILCCISLLGKLDHCEG